MIQVYKSYLTKLFLKKLSIVTFIFFNLILILSLFEEISFFKNEDVSFLMPVLLTLLNTPSTLFEIFPFIFLISSQMFFLHLINKKELEIFKVYGLSNFKILKIVFKCSVILGILLIIIFYTFSAKMKFIYLDVKNDYSNDNKYLAMVTENGLWIKDDINNKILITNALEIEDNYLKNVEISQFNDDFTLERIITSESINIRNKVWVIKTPIISLDNNSKKMQSNLYLTTHFDEKKINSLFSNLSALNIIELMKLRKDYSSLGYSTNEVSLSIHKISSYPIFLSFMAILSGILMLNIGRNKSNIFHLLLGIFLSVLIYYFYFLLTILGVNGKLPIYISVWFPLIMILFFLIIGLLRINEK